jgi:ferredoxin-thioredoxin reductase catalytic subunit
MRLIIIYGPPSVGKLTVATELAKTTGLKLFHYHLSIDLALKIFEFGTDAFLRLVRSICLHVVGEAIEEGVNGIIFTFVHGRFPKDNDFIDGVISKVEKHGNEVCLVRLFCDKATLEKRVVSPSRAAYYKIADVILLREILQQCDLFSIIPGRESLSIDNSHLSPEEVVRDIIAYYHLAV